MSKRLEDELRQMVDGQIPDLWNRIEAGLPEKPARKKKSTIARILPWLGGVAAAAVILIILIPTLLRVTKNHTKSATYAPNAEGAVFMAAEDYALDEAAVTAEMAEADAEPEPAAGAEEAENFKGINGIRATESQKDDSLSFDTKTMGQVQGSMDVPGEQAESEEEIWAEYGFCLDGDFEGKGYLEIVLLENPEDANALLEGTRLKGRSEAGVVELSKNSPLKPESGKLYRIDADDYGILLMEEYPLD